MILTHKPWFAIGNPIFLVLAGCATYVDTQFRKKQKQQEHKNLLGQAAIDVWSDSVLPDSSGGRSWSYIANWAAEIAITCNLTVEDVTYACQVGLLPPYDSNNENVIQTAQYVTTLAPLQDWIKLGPGWTMWHQAGLSRIEAVAQAKLPIGHPNHMPLQAIKTLAALNSNFSQIK